MRSLVTNSSDLLFTDWRPSPSLHLRRWLQHRGLLPRSRLRPHPFHLVQREHPVRRRLRHWHDRESPSLAYLVSSKNRTPQNLGWRLTFVSL